MTMNFLLLKCSSETLDFCFHFIFYGSLVITSSAFCLASGERLDGIDSEGAAQRLRGRAGTTVTVKVWSVIFNCLCANVAESRNRSLLSDSLKAWLFLHNISFWITDVSFFHVGKKFQK